MNSSKIDVGVLYVEDDELTRGMMQELLSDYVEPLYCAEDGQAGWELFKQHQPSIVVTDMRMPRMSGLELVAQIRAVAPDTKVIITSAYSDSEYLLQAIEEGGSTSSVSNRSIFRNLSMI
jgi:CheY-like chemotaxis protein